MSTKKDHFLQRDLLQSSERANEIRVVCLWILAALHFIVENVDPADDEYQKALSYVESMEVALRNVGVLANMQIGRPLNDYLNDPGLYMEWLAGQLFNFISGNIPNATQFLAAISEFGGQYVNDNDRVVRMKDLPIDAQYTIWFRDRWNFFRYAMDVTDDELSENKDNFVASI